MIKPKISPTGKQPIFVSTPEGKNYWKDMAGLYYRVKDKLNKLHNRIASLEYAAPSHNDLRMLEGICIKLQRDNKISPDDMRICNSLWKKYSK